VVALVVVGLLVVVSPLRGADEPTSTAGFGLLVDEVTTS
jgi:hypothetical protein